MNEQQLAITGLRILAVEAIERANSGHPGLPLGMAPSAYTLFAKAMNHNPKDPKWINRDRFILSAGHGSALLYSLLHLFGYGLTLEDMKQFRQLNSKTPGHPEFGHTIGVEATTGPLGQGIAMAVGMAVAEDALAAQFNRDNHKIIDHHTFVIAGDGCMQEGVAAEASSLAGTLGLGKLIVLYDSNHITIEGNTDISFREDVLKRYEAYGWQTLSVADGNDVEAIAAAVEEAKKDTSRPSIIKITTVIGYGCPSKQGSHDVHGSPLGKAGLAETKAFLGWPNEDMFAIPEAVYNHYNAIVDGKQDAYEAWQQAYKAYEAAYPAEAAALKKSLSGEVDEAIFDEAFWAQSEKKASRETSSTVLNFLAPKVPQLMGGSADLAPSTKTLMKGRGDYLPDGKKGANMHFGIREHAMTAMANGMSLHGGYIPYVSGFFVFSDYMKPAMRLSALMGLPVVYIFTHDSIGVGEDGPTHQPIEQLAMLRSIPNFTVIRPADAKEVAAGWKYALTHKSGPTALILTRQNLPLYDASGEAALQGAYIIRKEQGEQVDMILMATGSEVLQAFEAAEQLEKEGKSVRVVSMPSFEIFESQSKAYKESVLPKAVTKRIAIEAATSFGWHKYTGTEGEVISIDSYGASGPAEQVYVALGITTEAVVAKAKAMF